MQARMLSCIRCDNALVPVTPEDELSHQAYNGVVCTTSGNYGSQLFDSFDGSYLVFSLCDACLYAKRGEVLCFKSGDDTYVEPASEIFPSSFEVKKSCESVSSESLRCSESQLKNTPPLLSRKQAVRHLVHALGRRTAYGYVYGRTKKLSLSSLNKLVEVFHFGTRDSFEKALKDIERTLVRDVSRKQLTFFCATTG